MGIFEGAANAIRKIGKKKTPANGQTQALPEAGANIKNEKDVPKLPEGPADDVSISEIRSKTRGSVYRKQAVNESEETERKDLMKSLEAQYRKRLQTLKYFELIDDVKNPVITGIDNKQYPAPTMDEIRLAITPTHLEIIKHYIHKPKLLIVPIAMPLKSIVKKIEAKKGRLSEQNKAATNHIDLDEDLPNRPQDKEQMVYFPKLFDKENHGGMTKSELLQTSRGHNRFPGWQVLVVDGRKNLPLKTQDNPDQIKVDIKAKGLDGLVIEDWLMLHAEGVVGGQPFDDFRKGLLSWFLDSYLIKSDSVPTGHWTTGAYWVSQKPAPHADLSSGNPSIRSDYTGSRPAVRIF